MNDKHPFVTAVSVHAEQRKLIHQAGMPSVITQLCLSCCGTQADTVRRQIKYCSSDKQNTKTNKTVMIKKRYKSKKNGIAEQK